MFTVADARSYARKAFTESGMPVSGSRTILLDTDLLLQYVLGKPRTWLFTHGDTDISERCDAFMQAVAQRCAGLPIAYIVGSKEFFGLPFAVTPAVLIPKADTELLVELSLAFIENKLRTTDETLCILDPCTGSGCVFIAILHSIFSVFPESKDRIACVASDISSDALAVARQNAKKLLPDAQDRLLFMQGDMCNLAALQAQLPKKYRQFDLIAANPPYVPSKNARTVLQDGRNEPLIALDGGLDGLDFIIYLANNAFSLLKDRGLLLSEADIRNARSAACIFEETGLSHVLVHQDLAGLDRVVQGLKQLP